MIRLEQIEQSVAALSDAELQRFGEWFDDLRWRRWDQRLEEDSAQGRLDALANNARADIAAGKSTPL